MDKIVGLLKFAFSASILILATGCSTSNSRQIYSESREPSSIETPSCSPTCEANQVCMNTFKGFGVPDSAACAATPVEAPISKLALPFDSATEVICTHSSGSGSHSGQNAYFALDLATAYGLPPATVRASADGKVYVFSGEHGKLCPEPQGTPASAKSSECGNSWGNHIMISHGNGYASFYVHLDHFLVSNGAYVHQGDPIAVEGWTGAAGHRHLHWSIQKLQGSTQREWDNALSKGWTGASVPFHFLANQNGRAQNFDVTKIQCAHASIGAAPADQQPVFRGIDAAK